jgi:hypothetical protein
MSEQKSPNPRRQEAGRRNGALGKGRKSPAGRARSAQNALKHGLCCSQPHVILHEDEPAYLLLRNRLTAYFQPRSQGEMLLVESIVEAKWAVQRAEEMERQIINIEILTIHDEMREQYIPTLPATSVRVGAFRGAIERDRALEYIYRSKVLNERNYHRRIATYLKLRNLDLNPDDLPEVDTTPATAPQHSQTEPETAQTAANDSLPATEAIYARITFNPGEHFSYKTKVSAHAGQRTEPVPKQSLKATAAA